MRPQTHKPWRKGTRDLRRAEHPHQRLVRTPDAKQKEQAVTSKVVVIPYDSRQPIHTVTMDDIKYPALNGLLAEHHGGECLIELVVGSNLVALHAVCTGTSWERDNGMTMVVDEEGSLKRLPINNRASLLYGGVITGTALLVKTGMMDSGEGFEEPDLVGLPDDVDVEIISAFLQ